MTISTHSHALRMIGRIGEIWTEIDQAQQRRLEFRADLHAPTRPGGTGGREPRQFADGRHRLMVSRSR
jgi:hypothetical protein